MSRIGKQPILIPAGTAVAIKADSLEVTGPKGALTVPMFVGLTVTQEGDRLEIACARDEDRAYQGLLRSLLANAVTGVTSGWQKSLEINGVGMRAALAGSNLNLSLGFSHPVTFEAPAGIAFQVVKNVITVSGIDKQLVGETAAGIRKLKKPEPYKGKGIKYADEKIRRKAGKTGKAGK